MVAMYGNNMGKMAQQGTHIGHDEQRHRKFKFKFKCDKHPITGKFDSLGRGQDAFPTHQRAVRPIEGSQGTAKVLNDDYYFDPNWNVELLYSMFKGNDPHKQSQNATLS